MNSFTLSQSASLCAKNEYGMSKKALSAAPRVIPQQRTERFAPLITTRKASTVCVLSPDRPVQTTTQPAVPLTPKQREPLISREAVQSLEAELDNGESVKALRRFNDILANLSEEKWNDRMWMVWNELAHNLESFNPIFTAVMLKVQCTIGHSDYVRRDECLRNLIQPLAGEYGMHNDEAMGKTHRKLFSEFYTSCTGASLEELLEAEVPTPNSQQLFACMMRDVSSGGQCIDGIEQASYALGYNLAVEYLAAYEKTWLLDSFRSLDQRFLQQQKRDVEWMFLEIHAIGEPEHAEIGHQGVVNFVPKAHEEVLRRAMLDHDRDFAQFYNRLADLLC
ncbi:hypothetical protein CYMTET_20262 [Cymbomonas tetramitiformis]|uniref:Uncharacterized protein n=1 Tax=Cymbomonas tetramitiformis TaxID=36881 RepID=A0AAE0L4G7_9CHLO|nr:hypothetical protein CYMTET_20262 [Cymbomonas tetramitiformis]